MSFLDNNKLEFIGFEPSAKLRAEAVQTLNRIAWEAPSDSSIKLTIFKSKSLHKINCRIASTVGIFIGKGISEFGIPALELLEKDIQKKLKFWKGNRNLMDYRFNNNESQRVG